MKEIIRGVAAILLLSAAIFFASCEKENLGGANEKIEINFTLGDISYGENETVTRNAKVLASETVVVPMEGDLCMYAILEENEALRTTVAIANDTRLIIVAYDDEENYVNSAEYKVSSSAGDIEPASVGLSVPMEGNYTFVAYSFNNLASLPNYSTIAAIPISTTDFDLLWGSSGSVPVSASSSNVSILMKHMFSQVAIEITTTTLSATALIDADAISSTEVLGTAPTLSVRDGVLTPTASTNFQYFSFPSFSAAATVTSDARRVYTGDENTTSLRIGLITITDGDVSYQGSFNVQFNTKLMPGKSYTFVVSFKKVTWAGSNIYWDADESCLTFDAPGASESDQRKQGVFFKWGSLVGISPALNTTGESDYAKTYFDAMQTVIYVPTYNPGPPASASWLAPTTADDQGWTDWASIPYLGTTPFYWGAAAAYYLTENERNTPAYWSAKTGDICRFISENNFGPNGDKYRMPTGYEYGTKSYYSYDDADGWTYTGVWNYETSSGNDEGTYSLGTHIANNGHIFPASGRRRGDMDGQLENVGTVGANWSGSTADGISTASPWLSFSINTVAAGGALNHDWAIPVRCVKN
jgi:hypothetical protein